jgi:hypothetical protein
VARLADNPVLANIASDATWSVNQLAEVLAEESEEAQRLFDALSHSPLLGEYESALALSMLSQAVLGLAERQADLIERIERLEVAT